MNLFKSKFDTAYLKLTAFYVAIIMFISVSFSISIYKISSTELGRGLGKQASALRDVSVKDLNSGKVLNIEDLRSQQLIESNSRLTLNLIYFNLLILLLSTIGSYFFARKTMEPIEEAVEAQNRFTADASHELRTPLTAMRSEIEVSLRDKNLNINNAKKLFLSNLEEIEKLEVLSNALLKLAKHEHDEGKEFSEVSLGEIITQAYERVESLADEKLIKFKNDFIDLSIQGEEQSLIELFVILMENSIKYSPKESTISIQIYKEKESAIVKIKDHGIGIKASDLPYIFKRFYRADTSRCKEKCDGYGLGLSIAKQIVDLHQGEISVSSKPGKGSEFIVKLSA